MPVYCWKCGAQIKEGRPDCQSCRTPVHRPGLWERVRAFFSPSYAGKRSGPASPSRPRDVRESQTTVSVSRTGLGAATGAPEGPVLDPTVLPPEIQQRMRAGERVEVNLDDLPGEVRAQFDALVGSNSSRRSTILRLGALPEDSLTGSGSKAGASLSFNFSTKTSTLYKYRDASGKEHVCRSLDELPPEIRRVMESMGLPGKGPV
jgi:hypothetical protein